jgi:Protein of unknown function (DUF2933)
MSWLTGNSFFLIILLLCVGMHLFHGHGGHGGHGSDKDENRHDQHKHD